jgi:ribose 1,5-bisphosphate isomerase
MDRVRLTAERIRALDIQGATAIARSALLAYAQDLAENREADRPALLRLLVEARPNEPMLRNLLARFDSEASNLNGRALVDLAEEMLDRLDAEEEELHRQGAQLVEEGAKIFTHCHSSSAVGILLRAHREGKRFRVFTTETRPRFQGRITARELARAGIPVDHSVDSAAKYALDGASLFLFGADAILPSGFLLNKVGTGIFCVVARHYGVPTYSATHTLKVVHDRMDERVEERDRREVWDDPPEGVTIRNPAFDRVNLKYVSGIVTEKGILTDVFGNEEGPHEQR